MQRSCTSVMVLKPMASRAFDVAGVRSKSENGLRSDEFDLLWCAF